MFSFAVSFFSNNQLVFIFTKSKFYNTIFFVYIVHLHFLFTKKKDELYTRNYSPYNNEEFELEISSFLNDNQCPSLTKYSYTKPISYDKFYSLIGVLRTNIQNMTFNDEIFAVWNSNYHCFGTFSILF